MAREIQKINNCLLPLSLIYFRIINILMIHGTEHMNARVCVVAKTADTASVNEGGRKPYRCTERCRASEINWSSN